MTKIFYSVCNNGDGSASVWFFDSQECIDILEKADPDNWFMGEGGGHFFASEVSNITIFTKEQVLLDILG